MGKIMMSGIVPKLTMPSTFPPVGTALNDMTWEEIREVSDKGLAATYFSVGDTKTIVINGKVGATTFSNLEIDAFIIGIDHNSSREGTNRIHFQIGKVNGVDVTLVDSYNDPDNSTKTKVSGAFTMNTTDDSSGGWESCEMRTVILGSDSKPTSPTANTLLAALPADLRAVMKSAKKYSDNKGGGSTLESAVTATTDYLWLLGAVEAYGSQGSYTYYHATEETYQKQYDYYKAGNSRVKYRSDDMSKDTKWWTRSTNIQAEDRFCCFAGGIAYADATYPHGVSPAFCV